MEILTQRIYEENREAGYRVLVDRLWPRGMSKAKAHLDDWWKDIAPSAALRTWYGHKEEKWAEFQKKYKKELAAHKEEAEELLQSVPKKEKKLVLLYGAKAEGHNHALVLKSYLEKL